jgi:hypothetical protein
MEFVHRLREKLGFPLTVGWKKTDSAFIFDKLVSFTD